LGKTKSVDMKGASSTKTEIEGYPVVSAASNDAAAEVFGKDYPGLRMPGRAN